MRVDQGLCVGIFGRGMKGLQKFFVEGFYYPFLITPKALDKTTYINLYKPQSVFNRNNKNKTSAMIHSFQALDEACTLISNGKLLWNYTSKYLQFSSFMTRRSVDEQKYQCLCLRSSTLKFCLVDLKSSSSLQFTYHSFRKVSI